MHSVSFPTAEFDSTQIVVNGVLSATSAQFVNSGNAANSLSQIYVGSGGKLTASTSTFAVDQVYLTTNSKLTSTDLTGNTFNSALFASAADLTDLTNNQSFTDVDILAGTLGNGQNLRSARSVPSPPPTAYVFPGGFTVGRGAILNVRLGASVLIREGQQLLINGTLNVTDAGSFAIEDFGNDESGGITDYGTLDIQNTSLTRSGGTNGDDTTFLQVKPGADVTINNSAFAWDQLILDSGASSINISGNDFSAVGDGGVIATGATGTSIPLDHNYWGTSDQSVIQTKIDDSFYNSNLPTVVFQPFVNATETAATA